MLYSDKLITLVGEIPKNRFSPTNKLKKIIKKETDFLPENSPIRERIYYINNNIKDIVKCPICNNNTNIIYKNQKYMIQSCSIKCRTLKLNIVDDNGLSTYQKTRIKLKEKMSVVDSKTGLSKYQKTGKKIGRILNTVDLKTGLAPKDIISIKTKERMSSVNPTTGLTGSEMISISVKKTLSQIDNKTGLTISQSTGEKVKNTMLKVDPSNGLTGYQKMSRKVKKTCNDFAYDSLLKKFPYAFTLLTSSTEYFKSHLLKYKCLKCESIRESYWPYIRCTTCNPYNKSIGENEVLEFCKSLTPNSISNSRQIISPLELDIYISNYNLAIEYNGLYYHSYDSVETEEPNYHLMKTQECEKQGIQLFHIFENEWQDPIKQNIWKSIISNRLGHSERIFARKTGVRSVSSTEKSQFLISNHLQGDCMSSVNLGLYSGDGLVSLMTFGKSRYDKKIEWELIRFCNKIGYSVVGGASKLLKAFRPENSGSIISYADKRRSGGNLYKQLGFEFSHESSPNYFYWKSGSMVLEARLKYQKHKLRDRLEVFDPSLTESENMYRNSFRKIYDCGNQVWIIK